MLLLDRHRGGARDRARDASGDGHGRGRGLLAHALQCWDDLGGDDSVLQLVNLQGLLCLECTVLTSMVLPSQHWGHCHITSIPSQHLCSHIVHMQLLFRCCSQTFRLVKAHVSDETEKGLELTRERGPGFLSGSRGFFRGSTGTSMTLAGGGGGTVMGAPEMATPEIAIGGGGVASCKHATTWLSAPHRLVCQMHLTAH